MMQWVSTTGNEKQGTLITIDIFWSFRDQLCLSRSILVFLKDLEPPLKELFSSQEDVTHKGNYNVCFTWKIPWMEEPGRLQSMGSQRVRHDWVTSLSFFTFMLWRRKWEPTPVFLLENPWDRGVWWAAIYGVAQSWTRLKQLSSSSFNMIKYHKYETSHSVLRDWLSFTPW